ncbi:hypothetical protein CXB51_018950 [Gossypium anomalum]|uniref:DUF7745 domain-containing protein n=1 Tax=Gossypium anomalum TaxID=47600 RepID=A0A8J5YVG9_9ROSI|nr:hypothetical protein CXB51_018950 [Gossypium anomalum]
MKKRVDVFTLNIYGLVIFPKDLGHIDEVVSDLFNRLNKRVTPVPAILAETFRSLNACRRKVKKVSYRIFSENYSPLKEIMTTPRQDDITKEKWITILQNQQDEDVKWRAPWMVPDEILYRCEDFDWVPLFGIRGAIETVYASNTQCEFVYKGDNYKKKVHEISNAYNQTRRMKRFAANPMTTSEYDRWWGQRIKDNIPTSDQEHTRSMEEHLKVISSELEIIKQDFERKNLELKKG